MGITLNSFNIIVKGLHVLVMTLFLFKNWLTKDYCLPQLIRYASTSLFNKPKLITNNFHHHSLILKCYCLQWGILANVVTLISGMQPAFLKKSLRTSSHFLRKSSNLKKLRTSFEKIEIGITVFVKSSIYHI